MTNQLTLEQAKERESQYEPDETVKNSLKDKSLIMFVGPVATGKTFVMKNIVRANAEFHCVPSFTTRDPRNDDDPSMFRYMPHDDTHITNLLEKIQHGEAVQYAIHPTSHRLYGSEIQDYPKAYNMLATLSGVVKPMAQLPFKHVFVMGLVCTPALWETWLLKRFPVSNEDRRHRIEEAIQSLTWLIANDSLVTWIENSQGAPEETTRAVLDAVLYNKRNGEAKHLAYDMLKRAKELV